jgi:uncharacterized protein (DUF58 family)
MPSPKWSPPPIYDAARRALPLLYLAAAWPSPIPAAAALALLALELKPLARLHTPALLLHYAIAALLPQPFSLAFAAALIPLLHIAKTKDNTLPWYAHLLIFAAATASSPSLAPALAYTAAETIWYYVKFARDKPAVETPGRLETVAGRPLAYRLKIKTGVPAQAQLPDGKTVYVNGEAAFDVRLRFDAAGVYAPAITLTYTSPTKTVTYRRRLRHPPIYVIPRVRAAVELGVRLVAGHVEEVAGVREYVPGDPLRRLHWKKMAKILKPAVKMLEGRAAGEMRIAALLYATTPKAMDKVLETLAGAVATALTRAEKTEIHAITRRGVIRVEAHRRNYREAMEKLVALAEALDAKPAPAYADLAGLLPRQVPPKADLLIGERPLAKPLCRGDCILV